MEFKKYTKFFNYGYFLSNFEPTFLKKLLKATEGVAEINEPLKAGKSQHSREQVFDKLKSISKVTNKEKNKKKGIEPEM